MSNFLVSLKSLIKKGFKEKIDGNRQKELNDCLLFAVEASNLARVTLLLQQGANPNIASPHGVHETPLHIAAENGQPEIVRRLVEFGADINAVTVTRSTPLHYCVNRSRHPKRKPVARLLIELGASLNAQDVLDRTPLDYGGNALQELLAEREQDRLREAVAMEPREQEAESLVMGL